MTEEVLAQVRELLDGGMDKRAAAALLGVAWDTFWRAVWDGRLRVKEPSAQATSKSERSVADASAADGLGTGCTRAGTSRRGGFVCVL